MQGLGDLVGGIFHSCAFGVSADGAVVVGQGNSALGWEAFRWSATDGMQGLGDLPGGEFKSHAEDVLAGGDVVIGYGTSALGHEAFRWGSAAGMVPLGDLPGGGFWSEAWGGSSDGSLIVGAGLTERGQEAFLWDAVNGMRSLQTLLAEERGVDLAGWQLAYAMAMSADGRAIVGQGYNPQGQLEAWLAYEVSPVPEPTTATSLFMLLVCGVIAKTLRSRRAKPLVDNAQCFRH